MMPFAVRAPFLAAATLLGSFAASAHAADPVDLAPRLEPGLTVRYNVSTANTQSITFAGSPDERAITFSSDALVRIDVVEAPAAGPGFEGGLFKVTFERMQMSLESPGLTTEFDSEWPADRDAGNMIAPTVRAVVGKAVTARLDPAGAVAELTGVDAIAPEGEVGVNVRETLSAKAIGEVLRAVFLLKAAPFAVAPGDAWTLTERQPNQMGETIITETRTLTGASDGRATVGIAGQADLRKSETPPPGSEFIHWKGGALEGSAVWDLTVGRLAELQRTLTIEVVDETPVREGRNMTQKIITRTRIEPAP